MLQRHTYHRAMLLLAFSWLVLTVSARVGSDSGSGSDSSGSGSTWDGSDGSDGSSTNTDPDANSSSSSSSSNSGTAYNPYYNPNNPNSGNPFGGSTPAFDMARMADYRRVHGILAAAAMAVLFPVGSVLARVVPGRWAVWVHGGFQMLAWGVYVAAVGVGIYLVSMVGDALPGGGFFENPETRYHPIIGVVLLVLLIVQPIVGFVHHREYKKVQKRQVWSYLHLTIGRVGISLGIINGGLGLYLSGASAYHKRVYGIVAGIMWALWMGVAIWSEIGRLKKRSQETGEVVSKGPAGSRRVSQE